MKEKGFGTPGTEDWGEGSPGGLRGQSSGGPQKSFQNDGNHSEWFGNVVWVVEIGEDEGNTSELFNWKIERRLRELFPQLTPPGDPQSLHEDHGRDILGPQGISVPNSPRNQKIGCPETF